MIVVITGSIGSGKSSVAKHFADLAGARYYSADGICKELLEEGKAGYQDVKKKWGRRFLDVNNNIDRVLLRETIFENATVRSELEEILHPKVRENVQKLIHDSLYTGDWMVFEIPLLISDPLEKSM